MILFFTLWFICGIYSGILTLRYFERNKYLYKFNSKVKVYLFGLFLGPLPIALLFIALTIERIKRPQWQHINKIKSIEAVQKITDQDILIKIIHDPKTLPEVQVEAVKKISDEYVLRDKIFLSGLYFIVDSKHNNERRTFCKDFLKPNPQGTPSRKEYSFVKYGGENPSVDYYDGVSLKARFAALDRIRNMDIQSEMLMMFGNNWNLGSPFDFQQFFHSITNELISRIEGKNALKQFVWQVRPLSCKNLAIKRMDKEALFSFLTEIITEIIEERNISSEMFPYAINKLGEIEDERSIPILLKTLSETVLEHWEGRYIGETWHYGAEALIKMGEKARDSLLVASQSDNRTTSKWAQWAIKGINEKCQPKILL